LEATGGENRLSGEAVVPTFEGRKTILGRPTCMALPASLQHGADLNLGCMGVYTGLDEEEMYFVLRGKELAAIADSLLTVANANAH